MNIFFKEEMSCKSTTNSWETRLLLIEEFLGGVRPFPSGTHPCFMAVFPNLQNQRVWLLAFDECLISNIFLSLLCTFSMRFLSKLSISVLGLLLFVCRAHIRLVEPKEAILRFFVSLNVDFEESRCQCGLP